MSKNNPTLNRELAQNIMQVRPLGEQDSVAVFKFDQLTSAEKSGKVLEVNDLTKDTVAGHLKMENWPVCDFLLAGSATLMQN